MIGEVRADACPRRPQLGSALSWIPMPRWMEGQGTTRKGGNQFVTLVDILYANLQ